MIPRLPPAEPVPLSYAQERLWYLDQLGRGGHYNGSTVLRIRGALDAAALEAGLNEVVRRHAVLRTAFEDASGTPRAVVAPELELRLERIALGDEAEALDLARQRTRRAFELSCAPLLRACLVELGASEHLLVLVVHRLLADAHSAQILLQELARLYAARREGSPASLPELPIQYGDFAAWQRARVESGALDADLAYWRRRLRAPLPVLELPTDHPRPPTQTLRGAVERVALPAGLHRSLCELGRAEGVPLSGLLTAAFQLLLARHSGQAEVLVGKRSSGRDAAETRALIGPFASTLVLRGDLSGEPSFREWLQRVCRDEAAARAHAGVPFEKWLGSLELERDLSRAPVFQARFDLRRSPLEDVAIPGLELGWLPMDPGATDLDVGLELMESAEGLAGWLHYDSDLFEPESVARMADHYRVLLEAAVAAPDTPVARLPILGAAERQRVLVEWNASDAPVPDGCAHEWIRAQAERTPDAAAVEFEGEVLGYAELEGRANRLARYLERRGVGPEVRVGVCLERSAELVVALLAIWKAGGAYLGLDPDYPPERLAFLLEDSEAPLLLTETGLRERLPQHGAKPIELDAEVQEIAAESDAPLATKSAPEHLAYLIYTSGSTGKPKGVEVPQRTVANFLASMRREPGMTQRDRLLAITTLSFDIHVLELFLPLISGATLVMLARERAADGRGLREALAESRATLLQATPATWRMLLAAGWEGTPGLVALCGGEPLAPDLAVQLKDACAALWNVYGPTETTVWSTLHRVEEVEEDSACVSIGRPIANTRLYVLDPYAQPVPIGVAGELSIGGAGVTRGYLKRPELDAEKFVPDPFAGEAGGRLYRTGDRVCWRPDGRLAFLGRLDHQVKVRGFRIEPGEVETLLRAHPGLKEAVVVAREDAAAGAVLVGYVVARGGEAPTTRELRSFLRTALPDYMVPTVWVFLGALPLTPNGKVDRRALPAPEAAPAAGDFEAPRDETQSLLAKIWEKVLERAPVGIHDDFFDLGGHSLLAVKLLREIEEATGTALPVATIFSAPTVAEMAEILHDGDAAELRWPVLVPLQPRGSLPPFFFVAGVRHHFGKRLGPDQPAYRLQVQDLDRASLFTDVEKMAAHCLESLVALQPEGPYFLGGHCFGGIVALEIAQQLRSQGREVKLLVLVDQPAPGADRVRSDIGRLHRIGMRCLYQARRMRDLGPLETGRRLLRSAARKLRQALWRRWVRLGFELRDPRAANYTAGARYQPSAYAGRITYLPAGEQPAWRRIDPDGGWGELAAGGVEVHPLPGHHTDVYREPNLTSLVAILNDCLERSRED